MYCESLEEIILPRKLESIGDKAFFLCRKLKNIRIPKNVAMGKDIFYGCEHIEEI